MDRTAENARHCAAQVRAHAHDAYLAGLFVPADHRRAFYAVQAFALELAQVRALARQPMPGEIRLQWWRDALRGAAYGSVEANPVASEILAAIAAYHLPLATCERMIDAHRFDLYDDPVPDMAALADYAADTAGARLQLIRRILVDAPAADEAPLRDAGYAGTLCNLLVSLPTHSARRQCYLPADVRARHGVVLEDVLAGRPTAALRTLIADMAAQGLQALQRAQAHARAAAPAERPLFLPLAITDVLLRRLQRGDGDPFRPRDISPLRRMWLIWRAAR